MLQEKKLNKEEEIKIEKILDSWNINLHELRGVSGGLGIIWNPRKLIIN